MKVTKNTITKLVKCLENNCDMSAYNVRVENESDEWIVRYEDGNSVTHSIYFTETECITGYIVEDGRYRWHSTRKLSAFNDTACLLFNMALTLKAQQKYVEDYVLV